MSLSTRNKDLVYAARLFALNRFFFHLCPFLGLLLHASAFLFALTHCFSEFALEPVFRFVCHAGIMAQLLRQRIARRYIKFRLPISEQSADVDREFACV
jgi:hypothetical protein